MRRDRISNVLRRFYSVISLGLSLSFATAPIYAGVNPQDLLVSGDAVLVNSGTEFQGNTYNGFELSGMSGTFSSIGGEITRISFLDPDGDLIFAEFGSDDANTTLAIDLENFQGAQPSPYNQPGTTYVQGLPRFTIENSTSLTFFSVFSLGNDTARVDVALINNNTFTGDVDGIADIKSITVTGAGGGAGNIGGINAANAVFTDMDGVIGIDAEDISVDSFLFVGDMSPSGTSEPRIRISADSMISEILINGGDLAETTGALQIDTNGIVYTFPIKATDGQRSITNSSLRTDIGDGSLQPVTDTFVNAADNFFLTDGLTTIGPGVDPPSAQLAFTNPGPGGGSFLMSIAIHPTDPNLIYLGGDIEGPLLSIDGGQSYSRISGDLVRGDLSADVYASQTLHLDPGNPDRVYMASWGGLYRSDNRGQSWERLILDAVAEAVGFSVATIAVSPADSNLILAGVGDVERNDDGLSAIYRTADGGSSWNLVSAGIFSGSETPVHSLLFDTVNSGVVYAATGEGILKSTDSGQNWGFANSGLPNGTAGAPVAHGLVGVVNGGDFHLFATLRTQSETAFIAGGVYRSTDGAANWVDITGNLPTVQVDEETLSYSYWRIAVDPTNPDVVYIGTQIGTAFIDMGLYKTTNATAAAASVNWTFLWEASNFTDFGWLEPGWWNDLHAAFLGVAPSNPNVIYAGTDHIYKSVNGGATWTEAYAEPSGTNTWIGRGAALIEVFDIAVDPNNANRWWIGYDDMGLWRTDDGGTSFTRIDDMQQSPNLGNSDCACFVVTDPENSNILYVGRNQGENDLAIDWALGSVWKTIDDGQTWQRLGEQTFGNNGVGGRPFLMMLPGGAQNTRTIFAAIYGQGIFRSTDAGASWAASDGGISETDKVHVWTLAFDPVNTNTLYAGIADGSANGGSQDGGVYKSIDGGATWTKLTGNSAPNAQVLDLAVASDSVIYAATVPQIFALSEETGVHTGGLFRSGDGGATWSKVLDALRVDAVDVAPGDPRYVIAGVGQVFDADASHRAGIFISRDSGSTFALENSGLTHTRVLFAGFNPLNVNQIFVGTGGGALFVGSGVTE